MRQEKPPRSLLVTRWLSRVWVIKGVGWMVGWLVDGASQQGDRERKQDLEAAKYL